MLYTTWDLLLASCCFLELEFKINECKFDYEHYSSLAGIEKMKLGFLIVAPAAEFFVFVMIYIRLIQFLIWMPQLLFC